MLESKYLCTYDLFSSIPALDNSQTVTQEIFKWNEVMQNVFSRETGAQRGSLLMHRSSA